MRSQTKRPPKKNITQFALTMPFLNSEYHKLHYATIGNPENSAVLMLHGFLGSHQDFEPVLLTLSQHFYCVIPDLPGHGQTVTASNGYTFSAIAQTLLKLLDNLQIDRAHLLGYSMGGRLALYTLCTFPERFTRTVLESASPGLKTAQERAERQKRDWAIAHQLETIPLHSFLSHWYQNPLFNSLKNHPAHYQAMLNRRQRNHPSELASALRGFSTGVQPSLWNRLSEMGQPLLFIAGALDCKFVALAQEMLRTCRQNVVTQADIKVCQGCGHNIHLEAPDRYAQVVVDAFQ